MLNQNKFFCSFWKNFFGNTLVSRMQFTTDVYNYFLSCTSIFTKTPVTSFPISGSRPLNFAFNKHTQFQLFDTSNLFSSMSLDKGCALLCTLKINFTWNINSVDCYVICICLSSTTNMLTVNSNIKCLIVQMRRMQWRGF